MSSQKGQSAGPPLSSLPGRGIRCRGYRRNRDRRFQDCVYFLAHRFCDRPRDHGRKSTSPNPGDQIEDFRDDFDDTWPRRALAIFGEGLKVNAAEEVKTGDDVQRGRISEDMKY